MLKRTVKLARPGLKLRHPEPPHAHCPEGEFEVRWSSYWTRRVQDGDVVIVAEKKKKTRRTPPAGEDG